MREGLKKNVFFFTPSPLGEGVGGRGKI